jgi:hypothetical protein
VKPGYIKLALVLLLALFAFDSEPAYAHHSSSMYDMTKPVTVRGIVKRFAWTNPHSRVYLEVKDDKGKVQEWLIELMSVTQLKTYGWTPDMVKAGDVISCTGGPAKDGTPAMLSNFVRLADGRMIRS